MKPAIAIAAAMITFVAVSLVPLPEPFGLLLPLLVTMFVLRRYAPTVPTWVAALFSVAVLAALVTAVSTVTAVRDALDGTSDGRDGIVTSLTSWDDVALVNLEARRTGDPSNSIDQIPRRTNAYRDAGKVWVDNAEVLAVIPAPSTTVRRLAAVREGARGIAAVAVAAAIALVLWGLVHQTPFHRRTVRVLTGLGIVLLATLPMASLVDDNIASIALQLQWIGDEPGGRATDFTALLPGFVTLLSAAVIRAGVRLREDQELTI